MTVCAQSTTVHLVITHTRLEQYFGDLGERRKLPRITNTEEPGFGNEDHYELWQFIPSLEKKPDAMTALHISHIRAICFGFISSLCDLDMIPSYDQVTQLLEAINYV